MKKTPNPSTIVLPFGVRRTENGLESEKQIIYKYRFCSELKRTVMFTLKNVTT